VNEIEILGARYARLMADVALAEAVAAVDKREQGSVAEAADTPAEGDQPC
jgi:hypothetical protein